VLTGRIWVRSAWLRQTVKQAGAGVCGTSCGGVEGKKSGSDVGIVRCAGGQGDSALAGS